MVKRALCLNTSDASIVKWKKDTSGLYYSQNKVAYTIKSVVRYT